VAQHPRSRFSANPFKNLPELEGGVFKSQTTFLEAAQLFQIPIGNCCTQNQPQTFSKAHGAGLPPSVLL
jgi:hypothetical protein